MAETPDTLDDLNQQLTDKDLGLLQISTVLYYLRESNPDNGLVRDKTDSTAPVSIAACGMVHIRLKFSSLDRIFGTSIQKNNHLIFGKKC